MLQIRGQNIGGVGRDDGVDKDSNDPNKRPIKEAADTTSVKRVDQHVSTTNTLEQEADDPELEAAAARRRDKKAKKKKKKKNKEKEAGSEEVTSAAPETEQDPLKKQSIAPVEPAVSPKRTGSDDEDDEIRPSQGGAPEGDDDGLSRRRARSRSKSRSKYVKHF